MARAPNRLRFKDAKTPYSEAFDDVYFANEVGVDESIYVYLEGTGALQAIKTEQPKICIGEVGFGVGLNFILTLRAFLTESTSSQRLHYVSVEKFPIEAEDLWTLYRAYPDLLPYAEMLLSQYPVLTPGVHRLFFADHRFTLDLWLGDAAQCFSQADFKANFWYWDGFAPSKNPEAFSDELFAAVRKRSAPAACGTSFTAAGWVRRSLETHGFQVSKRTGFGKKRECILANFADPGEKTADSAPWFSRENISLLQPTDRIAVLGAGLAGSAIARALAERGYFVTVYDGNGVAKLASSNSVGLFNIQLSKKPNPISRFSQAALTHFLRELKKLDLPHQFGILRKDEDAAECLETSDYPASFFEVKVEGVFLPKCGMIHPQKLCEARMLHPNIQFISEFITHEDALNRFQHVIYAQGTEPTHFAKDLPIKAIRGQTILVKPTATSHALQEIKVEEGYVTPVARMITGHDYHIIGATYQAKEISADQIKLDNEKLVQEAKEKWKEFSELTLDSIVEEKVGFRASTPDKLPMIGPLADFDFLKTNYEKSLRGGNFKELPSLQVIPGQWVLMGLGSRGITFSSLGAEILASLMTGTPLPLEADLFAHLHPMRFAIRNLKKS